MNFQIKKLVKIFPAIAVEDSTSKGFIADLNGRAMYPLHKGSDTMVLSNGGDDIYFPNVTRLIKHLVKNG